MVGNKTVIRLFLAILMTFWIAPVCAEINLEKYEDAKGKDYFRLYITGVGDGYSWANTELATVRKLSPLYCAPGKVALNTDNYLHILDKYLSQPETKTWTHPTTPIALIFLSALQDAFPCK